MRDSQQLPNERVASLAPRAPGFESNQDHRTLCVLVGRVRSGDNLSFARYRNDRLRMHRRSRETQLGDRA